MVFLTHEWKKGLWRILMGALLLGLGILSAPVSASDDKPLRVVFLNPGHADESFWSDVDRFLSSAAEQLEVELTILHGERDVFRTLALGEKIAEMQPPPHFIFLVNEKNTGPRLYQLTRDLDTRVMFVLNDLTTDQKKQLASDPLAQQRLVGSLIPDNHWVGFQTAKLLHRRLKEKHEQSEYRWIALAGDEATPASIEREQGMKDYVAGQVDIHLLNTVYGNWAEEEGYSQTQRLLKRFSKLDAIWTANDHMAFGAIKALRESELTPGENVLLSSVNSSPRVLDALSSGEVSALGAGHFTAPGWALVMAYDLWYTEGHQAVHSMRQPLFAIVQPQSDLFHILRQANWSGFPIRDYSQVLNPDWEGYQFLEPAAMVSARRPVR